MPRHQIDEELRDYIKRWESSTLEPDAALGETVDVMRDVFGVYVEPLVV